MVTRLDTGIVVTRTKRRGIEIIRAYTPREWDYRKKAVKWWHFANKTIKQRING